MFCKALTSLRKVSFVLPAVLCLVCLSTLKSQEGRKRVLHGVELQSAWAGAKPWPRKQSSLITEATLSREWQVSWVRRRQEGRSQEKSTETGWWRSGEPKSRLEGLMTGEGWKSRAKPSPSQPWQRQRKLKFLHTWYLQCLGLLIHDLMYV